MDKGAAVYIFFLPGISKNKGDAGTLRSSGCSQCATGAREQTYIKERMAKPVASTGRRHPSAHWELLRS
jgi:hypothetical protein